MNQVYDPIWNILLYIFLFCFFIFSDEFYWIFYQGPPTVVLWYHKNVNLILAPRIFYFRNLISFFQLFQNLQEVSIFRNLFSHFHILIPHLIFYCNPLKPFLPSAPISLITLFLLPFFIFPSFSFTPCSFPCFYISIHFLFLCLP